MFVVRINLNGELRNYKHGKLCENYMNRATGWAWDEWTRFVAAARGVSRGAAVLQRQQRTAALAVHTINTVVPGM